MLAAENLEILYSRRNGIQRLLNPVNFTLSEGSVHSIVGKNGSGKTTLIKALTGICGPNFIVNGTIRFDNLNISTDRAGLMHLRKKRIKYLFQDSVNAFDPIRRLKYYFLPFAAGSKFTELMHYFQFAEPLKILELYPHQLSGGMAQRLGYILALLNDPDLLILDEPTSGIDYPLVNLLLHSVVNFASRPGKTVLIVTHDFLFAERAGGKAALLDEGTLSEFETAESFFKRNHLLLNIYKELK